MYEKKHIYFSISMDVKKKFHEIFFRPFFPLFLSTENGLKIEITREIELEQ